MRDVVASKHRATIGQSQVVLHLLLQFFCKAVVGEGHWKDCMDNSDVQIGDDATEAFVLLSFANNHKAWLCEEKATHGEALWTEHDSTSKEFIVDRLLLDQFVFEEGTADLLVRDTTKQSYKKAAKARKDWLTDEGFEEMDWSSR
jgi:hypothetical protein